MTEHSKFPPSSAARRVACAGSRALEAKYPEDQESPHAREGTAAHWLASEYLKNYYCANAAPYPVNAPNGEHITEEMHEGAELYASTIHGLLKEHPTVLEYELHIEERVEITNIHPECWGTPDCWFYDKQAGQLHVFDYKYGHGYVEVFENWQLIEYVAGIMERLGINGLTDQYLRVDMHIIQPRHHHRTGPVRTWSVKAVDLRALFNILHNAEGEAEKDNAMCRPSPECSFCLGRHACEALQRSALSVVDVTQLNTPWQLPVHSLGRELRFLKRAADLLESRISGLEEQATAHLRKGERVPFFKLEQSNGRERWKKPVEEVFAMGDLMGVDLRKPAQAITPQQALKAGIPDTLMPTYSERPAGSLKLVMDENNDIARKIFGGDK